MDALSPLRDQLRTGALRGEALADLIRARPPADREEWLEELLGVDRAPAASLPPHPELLGYHASGVGALLHLIRDTPVRAGDVFVDVGSGMGKVTLLVHLLTGARTVGLERDPVLVEAARERTARLGLSHAVTYVQGDARQTALQGSVYFLYLPFSGAALEEAMERLEEATRGRAVTVCTLGLDLARFTWLHPRECCDFWTGIYDRRP